MKKKSLTSICGSVVLAAFFACSNEVPGELEKDWVGVYTNNYTSITK